MIKECVKEVLTENSTEMLRYQIDALEHRQKLLQKQRARLKDQMNSSKDSSKKEQLQKTISKLMDQTRSNRPKLDMLAKQLKTAKSAEMSTRSKSDFGISKLAKYKGKKI